MSFAATLIQRAKENLAQKIADQNAAAAASSPSTMTATGAPATLHPAGFAIPSAPLVNLIPVINADRTNADGTVSSVPSPALTLNLPGSGAQQLPAVNTTATVIDWKKYLPWIIAVVVLILLVTAMRRKS